jgi:ribonucleoside-diphosphate reductase alpha chain
MRFAKRLAKAVPPEVELRTVETADTLTGVLAPRGWTAARVEAWLDWADSVAGSSAPSLRDNAALLAGGPGRFAARLSALALDRKVLERRPDALAFEAELTAAMLGGLVAFGACQARFADGPILTIADPAFRVAADRLAADCLGRSLAEQSVATLAQRLNEISDAVRRCEGDPAACADPAGNPALARAAHRARLAGADDLAIADAIALGLDGDDAGAAAVDILAPSELLAVAPEGAPLDRAATLAWRTGRLTLAGNASAAETLRAGARGPLAAVNAFALVDEEDLAAAIRAAGLAVKLIAQSGEAPRLTLAGVAERLMADGLAWSSAEGRRQAAALWSMAAETVRNLDAGTPTLPPLILAPYEDPELALRLGGVTLGAAPCPGVVAHAETEDGEI